MAYDIGPRIGIDGEREYREQIKNINQQMKTLDSQLQLTASEFNKEASAQEKADAKTKTLTKQIELQEQKLREQTAQMEKSREKTGENSTETQKYKEIVNKTTAELNKMKAQLDESRNKTKALADSMKSAGEKIQSAGSKISSIGNKMSKYVTTPILAAAGASFKMASDLQENINKTEVAFGDASQGVLDWSKTTITQFGLAQSTALEMASQFGDMATSMGMADGEAADMSKTLVGLAADLASFKNISTDQAMNALNGVFTGETKSLKTLGVVMTQANLKAFALSKGITTNIKDMSEAELVQLRYQFVLEKTVNAQGDFERTSDGAANQMRIVKERVKELGAQFGEKLLPIGEKLLSFVNDLLDRFSNLDDGTQNTIIQVGLFAAALGPVISTIGKTTQGIGSLAKGIGDLIEKAGSGEGAFGKLASSIGTHLGGLMSSTSLLSEALVIGGPAVLAFGAAMASIGDAIWNADKPLWEFSEDLAGSLPNVSEYESYINSASSALSNFSIEQTAAGQHLGEYDQQIQDSIGNIHTIAAVAAEESRQFTEAEWQEIQNLIGAIEDYTNKKIEAYEQQQKVVASMAEMEVEMTKERSAELVKAAEDTKNQTIAIANQQYQQLLTEAETMFAAGEIEKAAYDEMRENATKAYNDQVAKANKAYADTNAIISEKFLDQNVLTNDNIKMWDEYFGALESANTDYEAAVSMIRDKERQGLITHQMAEAEIADAAEKVEQGRLDMQKKMMQEAADNWDEQTADYVSYWMTMASNTELYGGKVSDKERDFIKDFIEIVDTLPDEMKDTAKEAMEGFGQEMSNRQPSLFDKAASIAGGIINTLNKAFDIHSPSRVMAEIAKNVWLGFENTTSAQIKVVENQAGDVAKAVINGINKNKDNAKKSAAELGELYVSEGKKKLSDLEALHRISEVGEVQYWEQILKATKKGTRAYTDALIELTKAKDSLTSDITKLSENYASSVAKVNETLASDLKKINDDLKTNVRNVNKTLSDGIKSLRENYRKAVSDRANEIKGSMGLFDEVKIEEGLSSSELIQNLRGQVDAIKEWDGLLDTLRERISNKELLSELESQGVESIDTLRSIAEMSDKELSTYQSLYAKKNKYATERAKTENEELRKETEAEIEQMRADAAKQIKKLNEDAEKQRKNLEAQAKKDIAALTKQYAKDLAALGVTAGTSGKDIGKQIANGIGSGFKTAMKDVKSTTKTELDSLLKTIKKKLGIASPSKVYAGIGEFMADGLGVGFVDEMRTVRRDIASAMDLNRSFSRSFAVARASQVSAPAVDAVGAMKQALQGVKIVLDDEVAGRFVEKTVTDIVYS